MYGYNDRIDLHPFSLATHLWSILPSLHPSVAHPPLPDSFSPEIHGSTPSYLIHLSSLYPSLHPSVHPPIVSLLCNLAEVGVRDGEK